MLDVLRASKGGIITWVFLGAIIIVFVISFGPGSLTKSEGGCGATPIYAAQVNGTSISSAEFERQFRQADEFYRSRYGEELAAMLKPELANQVLTSLVTRTLLIQEAERRGLVVTDEELKAKVRAAPEFQENGKYSKEAFESFAMDRFGSARAYLDTLRSELLLERLDAAFAGTVKLPESEIHETWKQLSDRVALTYVLFPTSDARADVKVSDADVQAFAAKEGARIEKFFSENSARFDQPRKVRVRHILARVQGKDDAAAKKKIEAAIERLNKGEDFAKVAAAVSEDENTKASGGDLGVIAAGQVDDAFAQAALALEAGKLSAPVKTPTGWHVIKADEVIPAKKMPLDQARPEIARELLVNDRAAALQKEKADAALQAARGGKALTELFPKPQKAEAATAEKPAVPEQTAALTLGGKPVFAQETGEFPASAQTVPQLNVAGDLLKDALAAKDGTVLPRTYETPAGLAVVVVKERKVPEEKDYATERAGVESLLKGTKAQQLRQAWATELRSKAKVVENAALMRWAAGEKQRQQPE